MAPGPKVLIYLMRHDLRVSDNPVLREVTKVDISKAEAEFTHVLPLYVFSPEQIEVSGFLEKTGDDSMPKSPYPQTRSAVGKFWRCGPHRAKFIAESVWDLSQSFKGLGSDLCVRIGYVPEVIQGLFDHLGASSGWAPGGDNVEVVGVWMTGEATYEEQQDEMKIKKLAEAHGKQFRLFKDEKYFIDDDDLPFKDIKDLPDVFTTYRKSLEPLHTKPRASIPRPTKLPPFPHRQVPKLDKFAIPATKAGLVAAVLAPLPASMELTNPPLWPASDSLLASSAHPFSGGETAALARLRHLLESGAMSSYKDTRNGLLGTEFSTKLSAYLALGCLSARQIHDEMALFEKGSTEASPSPREKELLEAFNSVSGFGGGENDGTKAVRFELLWRDYMRLCARKFGTKLFSRTGFRGAHAKSWIDVSNDEEQRERLDRFLSGRTGIGLLDASQRELFLTGYTSNRARQNVASFLAKHLKVDWRLGAEWYESMLVDYDAPSNWGNWQYVAGVGNDPRDERMFNPVKQALDYDAKGLYVKLWVPELRGVDVDGEEGDVDQEKMMGLFQAWRLDEGEKTRLELQETEWVVDPLVKIYFEVGRKPKKSPRVRNRERGGNGGGWGKWSGGGRGRGGWENSNGRGRGNDHGNGSSSSRNGRVWAAGRGTWRGRGRGG